jgi:hypothetical protein
MKYLRCMILLVVVRSARAFEHNWIAAVRGKGWFAYFRLYGPTEPYFQPIVGAAGFRACEVTVSSERGVRMSMGSEA